jgi:hypothetical protein
MRLGEEERWFLVCGAYGELRRLGKGGKSRRITVPWGY